MPKKIKPVELDMWYSASSGFVDLAQSASLVNRVSLRQGYQYAVDSVTLFQSSTSDAVHQVQLYRLPNHWPMVNSWVRCFEAWRKQERQVVEDNPSIKARYNDFKVCFNASHAPNASSNWTNKLPEGYAITGGTTAYEWQCSQIAVPNDPSPGSTEEYFMHVLGADAAPSSPGTHDGSKGMINGYAKARSRPQTQDPNVVSSESWLIDMFDLGDNDTEIWTNVREKNDEPPYLIDQETGSQYYPGGGNQGSNIGEPVAYLQTSQYQRQASVGGFLANCGLLNVEGSGTNIGDCLLRIRLVPGMYKGFMARSMHEVN
jgi:hypothetical protein